MLLENINEVIKASPAIQIQGKMTHLQRRAWNILLANAYNELRYKEIHSVSVVELAAKLGYASNDLDYLKETLKALRNFEVQWNILWKDKKQEWGVAGLLASADVKNGICTYAFAPHLRLKLHNPRIYTKLNLRLQNQFKGQYALILWEVCFDYFDTARGEGETPFIALETFRELMGIEADEYRTFKALNQTLIKPAINEINALTDYHVEVEQKRIGRKVAELKFRIVRVKQLPIQESVFPDIEALPPVALELVQAEVDRTVALDIADQEWEVISPEKLPTPRTYPDFLAYVCEKIEMVLSTPNVANRAGYIIEALRENYQDERVRKARQIRAEKLKEKALEDMNLAKINEVIKASPAIQIQSRISLLQRRAWNVLLANAYNELPEKDTHRVSLTELATKLGFGDGNQAYLKGVLKSIVDCTVEWNLLNKDNKQVWGAASLLAFVEIEDGICFYQFPHPLRLKLHNPRVYAKLNLRLQNQFTSKYALVLWELCFDYFDRERDEGETPFIALETFRELMGIEADEYQTFKALNRDVIKSAIKEINTLTNYHIEVEQKRIGRKVAELKFRIQRVKQLPVQESVFPDIENLPPIAVELVQAGIDRKVAEAIAEQQWAFVSPEKLSPPGTYPDFAAYISEKIEMSLSAATVANRAGYIIEALRENYQDERVRKARQIRAEKLKEKALEDLTEAFHVKRNNIVRQAIQANPTLIEKAAERVETPHPRKRLQEYEKATQAYQESPMVKVAIDEVIADEFCNQRLAPITDAYEDEKRRILAEAY